MKVLVCAEVRSGELDRVSLELLQAARGIVRDGDEVTALVVADGGQSAALHLGSADRVILALDAALAKPTAEAYRRILCDVTASYGPDLVLIAYSTTGLGIAADLAYRVDLPLVAYVTDVQRTERSVTATAQLHGGKILANVMIDGPAIVIINPGVFEEIASSPVDPASIVEFDPKANLEGLKIRLTGEESPELGGTDVVDLMAAERIVCVGRGIGDEHGIPELRRLAVLLNAELAGSRPIVDNGWLPKHLQVGKSGHKVKPRLYLALGVSGAPEHLEGMARSDLIIAVNTDPQAPIFGVAHYGVICDVRSFAAALSSRLESG